MSTEHLIPSQVWRHPEDHHLRALKNPWYQAVADLQNAITELTVGFWSQRGGQTVHLPVTTGSISSPMGLGSDSAPVKVRLEGVDTYLADSMQFMLEYGCRLVGRDCYYIMPSFRGEANDASHLAQFFHSEAEIEGSLDDVIAVVEAYLVHLAAGLLESSADTIRAARRDLTAVERLAEGGEFNRLTFEEAAGLVGGDGVEHGDGWRSLTRGGEREIMRRVGEFTWVTHWDHLSVPFYQAFDDEGQRTARNGDLLFGVGEVVGAGERHETSGEVRAALALHAVGESPYRWYCDMRDAILMRTSGFGMGIERFLMWLLDHDDIRDLQLLPRENGRDIVP